MLVAPADTNCGACGRSGNLPIPQVIKLLTATAKTCKQGKHIFDTKEENWPFYKRPQLGFHI
jgi:hypothetical protein